MLSIGKLAAGQEAYYLGKVAEGVEDYYVGGGEAQGRWTGEGSRALGLSGDVEPEHLRAMLGGADPISGKPLRGDKHNKTPGFDLTFSAPKGVSLLWAFGDKEMKDCVIESHEKAIDSALTYLEENAVFARRGAGGKQFVRAPKLLAAAYRHRTSRAGDPQLHTHALVSNFVQAEDGRWSSMYSPSLYAHAKTAGYLYQAELRYGLTRSLGIEFGEVVKGAAPVKGIELSSEAAFSTRRAEILISQAEKGSGSKASLQASALETRRAKDYDIDPGELEVKWDVKAGRVGISGEQVIGLKTSRTVVEELELEGGQLASSLTNDVSHFTRQDVVRGLLSASTKGARRQDIEALADRFTGTEQCVEVAEHNWGKIYSTPELVAMEQELLAVAKKGVDAGVAVASVDRAEVILAERGMDLDAELATDDPAFRAVIRQQREMVLALTTGGERIAAVSGVAGSGKTYALAAAHEIWAGQGTNVIGACTSWQAADVLAAQSGIPTKSIAARLFEFDKDRDYGYRAMAKDSVLVIDEAGMVGTKDFYRLLQHVLESDAKLLPIGDYEQLPAVSAGGAFRSVVERFRVADMPHSRRQVRPVDRAIVQLIRDGNGVEALDILRTEQGVTVADTGLERDAVMTADWWEKFSTGEDAVMIAETNRSVGELNALARALMKDAEQLGDRSIKGPDGAEFSVGDRVLTRVNDHQAGIRNLQSWQVVDLNRDAEELKLRAGGDEREVWVGRDYLDQNTLKGTPALQHGYAVTGHVAQGATHDFVFAQGGSSKQWNMTAFSRGKEPPKLYMVQGQEPIDVEHSPTVQKTGLDDVERSVTRDVAEVSATDIALHTTIKGESIETLRTRLDLIDWTLSAAQQDRFRQLRMERDVREALSRVEAAKEFVLRAAGPYRESAESGLREADARHEQAKEHLTEFRPGVSPGQLAETHAEKKMVERELHTRRARQVTADRVKTPPYIEEAIGEPPEGGHAQAMWVAAADDIEKYRQRWGVSDKEKALGHTPKAGKRKLAYTELSQQLPNRHKKIQVAVRVQERGGLEAAAVEISGPEEPGLEISM